MSKKIKGIIQYSIMKYYNIFIQVWLINPLRPLRGSKVKKMSALKIYTGTTPVPHFQVIF